ncbi:hypothetical protein CHS0354_024133 [Potamilus streckersoni]|uniref:LTD domain-containing protein n=1 Tax=Potamilus streckersoni TaxID=2493646 RepID=A0AAE0RZP9_9BIVA|nr:hypothetical protein CHS0354_024133 [Potamilus streckersoni]
MYDPTNGTSANEFIELYNLGASEVDLANWKLEGSVTTALTLTNANGTSSAILQPNSFAVVFSSATNTFYNASIPTGALILNANGSLSLNNTDDKIILKNNTGDIVVSLSYEGISGKQGYSLEKIILNKGEANTNYGYSMTVNGTPGKRNTLTPFEHDLGIRSVSPQYVPFQESLPVSFLLTNVGLNDFTSSISISLFYDKNKNRSPEATEKVAEQSIAIDLQPNMTKLDKIHYTQPELKDTLHIILILLKDDRSSNDTTFITLVVGSKPKSIVFNEIMYEPVQDANDFIQDQPDFIELYNASETIINLNGWQLRDKPNENGTFNKYTISTDINGLPYLPAKSYCIIVPDTTKTYSNSRLFKYYTYLTSEYLAKDNIKIFFVKMLTLSLGNEGDELKLIDLAGTTIDSVSYLPTWHSRLFSLTRGLSLEKRNPYLSSSEKSNWTTCTDRIFGATPGKQNSTFINVEQISPQEQSAFFVSLFPNPFSPDGDGYEDALNISYTLASSSSHLRVRIYDKFGRLVKTIFNQPTSSNGPIIWDGMADWGTGLPIGKYILLFEATHSETGAIQTFKQTIVIAKKF